MKNLSVFFTVLLALSSSAEVFAQSRPYGGGGPGGGGMNRPSPGPGGGGMNRPFPGPDRPSPGPGGMDRPSRPFPGSDRPDPNTGGMNQPPRPFPGNDRPSPGPGGMDRPSRPFPGSDRPDPNTGGMNQPPRPFPGNDRPSPGPGPRPYPGEYRPRPFPVPVPGPGPIGRPDPRPFPGGDRPRPGSGGWDRPSPRPFPGPGPIGRPDPRPYPGEYRPRPGSGGWDRPSPRPFPGPVPGPISRPDPRPYPDYDRPFPGPGPIERPRRPGPIFTGPRPYDYGDRYTPPMHQRYSGRIVIRRVEHHIPRPVPPMGPVYRYPRDYYSSVSRIHIFRRWVQEPVIFTYSNGYWNIDNYPYYVYQGYRYRYSPVDNCQYQLVDSANYSQVATYPVEACSTAYDTCALQRDRMNDQVDSERYFCAEAVDDDQVQSDDDYDPSPVDCSDNQVSTIQAYLDGKSFQDLFDDRTVGSCAVSRVGGSFSDGNQFGCRYIVKIGDNVYPQADQSVCSEDSQAALIGCNVGTEQENAGCILQQAIEAGYCI